jgi:hypothetical protein
MNNRKIFFFQFFLEIKTGFLFLSFLSLFVLGSCKHQQKIVLNSGKCLLNFKNAKTLTSNLKASEFKFDRLNAKLTVEALIDSSSESFTVSIRIKKDSIIWMSISKMGIEGARMLITKDSVKFTNTMSKKYFKGDFAYLSQMLNTELDFEILQSLLIGNSVTFYDEEEKLKPGVNDCQYTLGTIRKKKLRRVMEKGKELKEPVQSIYLIPETYKISRIIFYDFNPDRSLDAQYSNFEKVDSLQWFPQKMSYVVRAQKNISVDINYSKVILNADQTFPFKIPSNYEPIETKKDK